MKTIDSDNLISKIITHDFKANMDANANTVAQEIIDIIRNTTDAKQWLLDRGYDLKIY
ncbi:MAG: hypothetical protein J6R32_03180 [Bacteroidales bacterium]|nr:hypothetical protein [Bacteroidales bacterium]